MRLGRVATAVAAIMLVGARAPERPPITGISHLAVYSRDLAAAERFYVGVLGARSETNPENPAGRRFALSGTQYVEVLPAPPGLGASLFAHAGYRTADAAALRGWLLANGARDVGALAGRPGDRWFAARDAEGNQVQFVETRTSDAAVPGAVSGRIIHVGHAVRDRAAQDGFYRRLLGFRPYWLGSFEPPKVDWVSQQTPDGRDWLEYMMVGQGSRVTEASLDARQLGVLNHLSLGVRNMQTAVTELYRGKKMTGRHDGPQMGLDGKWQANLYDPDGTRIELMEFHAVTEPCCSPFTAPDPEG
ncbi:VOC family protein [Sphingomonas sp. BK235]|uniref:VOC family protein n=1 Tax=Sphingomonas sp. BK235 TaxID=2512131 RepID=UPI0010530DE6|nr:VOC family protein [Sphingomonas sp. BK235]TCP36685.1 catechol 2,3-dioxygenase-like lactoylglutathione lyase family enzyme [Sphingomonas sp. BK235]